MTIIVDKEKGVGRIQGSLSEADITNLAETSIREWHIDLPLYLEQNLFKLQQFSKAILNNQAIDKVFFNCLIERDMICFNNEIESMTMKRLNPLTLVIDNPSHECAQLYFQNVGVTDNLVTVFNYSDDWQVVLSPAQMENSAEKTSKHEISVQLDYVFQGKKVLSFYFDKNEFCSYQIYQENQTIKTIPRNLFNPILIYYCLQKEEYFPNHEAFKRFVCQYFNGPQPDHVDYELGSTVIFSKLIDRLSPETKEQLADILEEHGIDTQTLPFEVWLRDFVFCLGSGDHGLNPMNTHVPSFFNEELWINEKDGRGFYGKTPPENFKEKGFRGSALDPGGLKSRSQLINYARGKMEHSILSELLLEHGNLLSILSPDDRLTVIVGRAALITIALYRQARKINNPKLIEQLKTHKDCKNKNAELYRLMEEHGIHRGHIKEAEHVLKKYLRSSSMIVIPNPAFHIDMMLAVGPKCIFLQNFLLVYETAMQAYQATEDIKMKNIADIALEFHHSYGGVLADIKRKLTKHGLRVIDVPGVVYEKQGEDYHMSANYMNAITGRGKPGEFHIALTGSAPVFEKAFRDILQKEGVSHLYFIGTPEEAKSLLENSGSLRCLSIFGNKLLDSRLDSSEDSKLLITHKNLLKDRKTIRW